MTREREGILLCLLAALAYCTTPILAKYAYAAAVGVVTLLVVRYLVAVVIFWLLVRARRGPVPPRTIVVRGVLIGLLGTSVQVFLFATALTRIDASLGSLLLYTYPAMVALGAFLTGQERPSARRIVALLIASVGVVLVLGGADGGRWDTLGVLCALGSALAYTIYLLISHSLLATAAPLPLAALGSSGAATTFLVAGAATGQLAFDFASWGWWPVVGMALASVVATIASLAGVIRVGPTTTSIVTMMETPLTVGLAYLALGERLLPVQLAGGALVLAAVVLLQAGRATVASSSADIPERGSNEAAPVAPL
jgi:drug/metabolite transporter (DMT)-like permease